MLNNRQMLLRKIREAIHIEDMILRKITVFHLFQKPCHLVSGVPFSFHAEAVIYFHYHGQFFQLLRKTAFRFLGSMEQIRRRNAAFLEFVHSINEFFQEFRSCFNGSIRLKSAAELSGGRSHSRNSAAIIQTLLRCPLHCFTNSSCHARKCKHFGIAAGCIPRRCAKESLRLMADQFRNYQNPSGAFMRNIRCDSG